MAIGDKKPVVMQSDRAVPSGIATLGADGKLLDAQIPSLAKLGAAPSGYGLGGGGVFPSSVGLSGSAIARGGFFRWDTAPDGAPFNYATMLVVPRTKDSESYQLAFGHVGTKKGVMATRRYSSSEDEPWEYINPPMITGEEYRTTERYNGKPVYTALVNVGDAPVGLGAVKAEYFYTITQVRKIIRQTATTGWSLPSPHGGSSAVWRPMGTGAGIDGSNKVLKVFVGGTEEGYPVTNIEVQVWYTKTTD